MNSGSAMQVIVSYMPPQQQYKEIRNKEGGCRIVMNPNVPQ